MSPFVYTNYDFYVFYSMMNTMEYGAFRGVARAIKVGGINENFCHALYFSEDLLLTPPPTYFLISFKESGAQSWQKWGGSCPPYHPWPRYWMHVCTYVHYNGKTYATCLLKESSKTSIMSLRLERNVSHVADSKVEASLIS